MTIVKQTPTPVAKINSQPKPESKKVSNLNPLSTERKVYRFAVYGWRDSGKTCLMAALGMPRHPNPKGYTATRVALQIPSGTVPSGSPLWPFIHGRDWLDKAVGAIAGGRVPDASPNTDPVSFLFEFAAPGEGPWLVELVDFSGELVNPNAKIADLADKLREKLKNFDGLFVLAEHPRATSKQTGLSIQLSRVLEAFTLLQSQKKIEHRFATPVALLFNKWDRSGNEEHPVTDDVVRFLNQPDHRAHLNLRNALANASDKANFETFPVSAFGKSRLAQINSDSQAIDLPVQTEMLASVALEDPFVWACRRRDEIDLQAFEETVERRACWKLWQIASVTRVVNYGRGLCKRFRKQSTQQQRSRSALKRAWATSRNLVLTLCGLAVTSVGLMEYQLDDRTVRAHQSVLDSPEASLSSFMSTLKWYDDYYASPKWRHLPYSFFQLPKSKARDLAAQWREKRERDQWQIVVAAEEIISRAELAARFAAEYPTSQFLSDAFTYVNDAETLQKKRRSENEAALEAVQSQCAPILDRIKSGDSQASLATDIEKIESLIAQPAPHPPWPADLLQKHTELQSSVADLRKIHGENILAHNARNSLRKGQLDEAIKVVSEIKSNSAQVVSLRSEIGTQVIRDLKSRADKATDYKAKIECAQLIKKRCNDSQSSDLIGVIGLAELQRLARSLDQSADETLWERVRSANTRVSRSDSIETYRAQAPLKKMIGFADDYQRWLSKIEGPLTLRFKAVAQFGNISQFWYCDFGVRVNSKQVIDDAYVSRADDSEYSYSFDLENTRLSDTLTIEVTSKYKNALSDNKNGRGETTETAKNLMSSKIIYMDRNGNRATVTLDSSSLPSEPSLPAWVGQ